MADAESVSVSFESKCIAYLSAVQKENASIKKRASSTGFFWRKGDRVFLITSRHCVTGRNGLNERIGSFDPNELQIYFRVPNEATREGDSVHYENKALSALLWKDGDPNWLERPEGPSIDVVALDFTSAGFEVHCVNDKQPIESWELEAGTDCFIVGFPEALGGSEGTPIWKRASIASEPNLDYKGLPVFLCDSATRKGLSGAPVFAKLLGNFGQQGQPFPKDGPQIFGYWTTLIGVYTGREGEDRDGFQLGRVWKTKTIDEIVEGSKQADSPFFSVPDPRGA